MGLGKSKLRYEGYGRDLRSALHALDSLLRFHYDHASVRVRNATYFVWDGEREHVIYYEKCRGRVRVFLIVGR